MPSPPSIIGIAGVAEMIVFVLITLATSWARALHLPSGTGKRWYALYQAIAGTLVLIAFVPIVQFTVPGGLQSFAGAAYYMPALFRVIVGGLILFNAVMLVRYLRFLDKARAAKEARGYNWPYGSDNPQ